MSLRRHAIANNLVDELRLSIRDLFVRVHVWPDSSLATVSSNIDSGTRTSTICSSIHSGVSFACGQSSSLVWCAEIATRSEGCTWRKSSLLRDRAVHIMKSKTFVFAGISTVPVQV